MSQLFLIQDCKAEYSKNLAPIESGYNGTNTFVVSSGGTAQNSIENVYSGAKSLRISVPHSNNNITVSTITDVYTAFKTGIYVFAFRVLENSLTQFANNFIININFYKNNVFYKTLKYNTYEANFLNLLEYQQKVWNTFSGSLDLAQNDVLTWSYEFDAEVTQAKTSIFYIDGVKIEYDDRKLNGQPTYYTEPQL